MFSSVGQLSNLELLARVKSLAQSERQATTALIAHLAELEERGLHLAEGYSSLFTYCTQVLHLSEHAAYGRIEAARVVRKFPILLEWLEFHHVTPYAAGGEPAADNIQLRCRAHNGYEAELDFGPRHRLVVREARASYMHPPQPAARTRLVFPATTRSGPSTEWAELGPPGARFGYLDLSGSRLREIIMVNGYSATFCITAHEEGTQ